MPETVYLEHYKGDKMSNSEVKVDTRADEKISVKNQILYSLGVGVIATLLMTADGFIAPLFIKGSSFAWIAFINWTMFIASPKVNRFKAVVGYMSGYLIANFMIWFGSTFDVYTGFHLAAISIGTLLITFIINVLLAQFGAHSERKIFNSIPATFLGMSLAFSGLGKNVSAARFESFAIILVYGIIGLLCCFGCDFLSKKFLKNK